MKFNISTCALCPRLCRPACPVTVGTGREAATPTAIAGAVLQAERGRWTNSQVAAAVTLCTDCGACEDHCHIGSPLPETLREWRRKLLPEPPVEPLQGIEGIGDWVAVEADERPLARVAAQVLGEAVRCWRTGDALGVAAVEHPGWEARAEAIRAKTSGLRVLVHDGGVAQALDAAGVGYAWLAAAADLQGAVGSCRCATTQPGPLACCGGAGPLPRHHPEDASRVGRWWLSRRSGEPLVDGRCRNHLRRSDSTVLDVLDVLMGEAE